MNPGERRYQLDGRLTEMQSILQIKEISIRSTEMRSILQIKEISSRWEINRDAEHPTDQGDIK